MLIVLAPISIVLLIACVLLSRRLAVVRGDLSIARARLEDREQAHRSQLDDLRVATEEKIALVTTGREEFVREMEAVSAKALQGATEQVTRLAAEARQADRAAADGDAKLREQALTKAVAPIAEHLRNVETQVAQLQRDRQATYGTTRQMFESLTREVDKLRSETGTLVTALKRPQVRGAWGEMQLRNIVKSAGMTEHVDFHDQVTIDAGDEGRFRPDMTVHLPTDRDIVVDSKVPLDAYLAATEAQTDEERERHLDRHALQIRRHLDQLGTKAYHRKLERSADFVVCFLPNEACYVAALDRDPGLLQHGADRHVLIATPTTLLALLHATHYGWQQAAIERSAEEVAAAARELHKRCAVFVDHFAKVGSRLDGATAAYNQAVGSLESRVLPQLRKIEALEVGPAKEITTPAPVETVPRPLTAAETPRGVEAA